MSTPTPEMGVGLIYWPELDPLVESRPDLVQVIEIETEVFWRRLQEAGDAEAYTVEPAILARLDAIPQPKLIHGVGQPVGSTHPRDPAHAAMFHRMIAAHGAAWASEHLSFNQADFMGGRFPTGFLLPPLPTCAGAEAAVANIREVTATLPVPFAFETGVNYLHPRPGELSDGAFVREVAEGADCGILLDLHNLWANEQNGRQPVREFIAEIPRHRVCEIHLAGGFEMDGYWLDAHSGAIPELLLALAEEVVPQLPNLGAFIYEISPDFVPLFGLDQVTAQLERMHRIWRQRQARPFAIGSPERPKIPPAPAARWEQAASSIAMAKAEARCWENTLGALLLGEEVSSELAADLSQDPALNVVRRLIQEQRAGTIVECLRLTSRLILLHCGAPYLRSLLVQFWSRSHPSLFATDEAAAFGRFLLAEPPDIPHLMSVLQFELVPLLRRPSKQSTVIPFGCDPLPLLQALAQNRLPDQEMLGQYELEVASDASKSDAVSESAPAIQRSPLA